MQTRQSRKTDIINGFRCLAILDVLFFHFYSKWTTPIPEDNYYPGGNVFHIALPDHWNLDVQFFFVISGFVIFSSLERCDSIFEFLAKRIIKLFPAILLCSTITFIAIRLIDHNQQYPHFHSRLVDFLPSITFTPPSVWRTLLNDPLIDYINGSYWSLFPQIGFYVASGIVFFVNRKHFLRNWFILILSALLVNLILIWRNDGIIGEKTLLPGSWTHLYFSSGVLLYALSKKRQILAFNYFSFAMVALFTLYQSTLAQRIGFGVMISLFLLYIYREEYLAFLKWKFFYSVGVASYALYLIHENIGVVLINKLTDLFQGSYINIIIPIFVTAFLVVIARLVHVYYEKPVDKLLLNGLQLILPKGKETKATTTVPVKENISSPVTAS